MPIFNISVKWGKEKYDVQCNTDETLDLLRAQLYALSGVPPDRQKLLGKGVNFKDNTWGDSKIKNGMTLMMMGSTDALPSVPTEVIKFVEDMTEDQLAHICEVPSGLQNLGNTCYMNATLQCLKSVPELRDALELYKSGTTVTVDQKISGAVRDLFVTMKNGGVSVPPFLMLSMLHTCFPQFSTTGEGGGYEQQDANECWTALVRCLQKEVPLISQASENQSNGSFIDKYFSGEYAIDMKCIESDTEPATQSVEPFSQLSCFIDKDVKYLSMGLKSRLEEHVEKNSPTLGKNAQYKKSSKISRLPAYVTIQMVRFFYKEKEHINAKILKDIKFPLTLDLHDLCTDDLKAKQLTMRNRFKTHEDKIALSKSKTKGKLEAVDDTKFTTLPYSFSDDIGSNNSGYYELQAVLTHKGRSSSSGHYVAWTRFQDDEWLKFDDDHVTSITSDEIVKLSGGGDWHCAYILLYGPRQLKIDESDAIGVSTETEIEKMAVDC